MCIYYLITLSKQKPAQPLWQLRNVDKSFECRERVGNKMDMKGFFVSLVPIIHHFPLADFSDSQN